MFDPGRRRRDRERNERLAAVLSGLTRPEPKHRFRAAGGTGRAVVFRLRRQLAPLAVVAGLWLAGVAVDEIGIPAPAVALVAVLAAVALWRLRYMPRLDRVSERRYAAACLTAGVVWLTLVAALGLT